MRAGILAPDDLPEEVADGRRAERARAQIGAFMDAVLDAVERTGRVGMTEPAASALAAFRAFNFDRIYLRPAARRQAEQGRRAAARPRRLLRRRARARDARTAADLVAGSPGRGGARGPLRERHDRPLRARRSVSSSSAGGPRTSHAACERAPTSLRTRWASSTRTWLESAKSPISSRSPASTSALKRVGRRFVGLCPFHSEKSPSFSINPEMGVLYCFGCQKSGDAITFVREVEHLDFVEAVERLAARAGITLRYDDASFSEGAQAQAAAARRGRRARSRSTTSCCSRRADAGNARGATCAAAATTVTSRAGSRSASRPTATTR